jgi:hypothetical protein
VVALEGCESTEKAVYFIQEPSIAAWLELPSESNEV